MIICALDTASEYGSIVVQRDGTIIAGREMHSPAGFGHLLFPALQEVLQEAAISLAAVDCFAATSGPGAFTGVRVGLAAIKGLSSALRKQAIGISNLRACAAAGVGSLPRAVVCDARRGDVFGAVYRADGELVAPEVVTTWEKWLSTLIRADYQFILPAEPFPIAPFFAESEFASMPVRRAPRYLASLVALCAEQDGERGLWSDGALLDANYVRRADAELAWQDCSRLG